MSCGERIYLSVRGVSGWTWPLGKGWEVSISDMPGGIGED